VYRTARRRADNVAAGFGSTQESIMSSQPDLAPQPEVAPPADGATNMTPLPQPPGPTATQTVLEDYPGFKMYKELAVVEV
jgi:hypothetical protein